MPFEKEEFKVWVGGLPRDIEESEIRRMFEKSGHVLDVKKRSSMKDTFCFVTFDSHESVERAMRDFDQKEIDGIKIKVSFARPEGAGPVHGKDGKGKGKGDGYKGKGRDRSRSRGRFVPELKVQLENIPQDMQWNELKDLARTYVTEVSHADTWWDGPTACGTLKIRDPKDADTLVESLNGRRMKDISGRLRVWIDQEDGNGRQDSFQVGGGDRHRERRDDRGPPPREDRRGDDRGHRDEGRSFDWRRGGGKGDGKGDSGGGGGGLLYS